MTGVVCMKEGQQRGTNPLRNEAVRVFLHQYGADDVVCTARAGCGRGVGPLCALVVSEKGSMVFRV